MLLALGLFFLAFSGVTPCTAQQSELDTLATQVAHDLAVFTRPLVSSPPLSKSGSGKTSLIVTDFPTLDGSMSQLGIVLADRFAQALEKQAKNTTLTTRDCLHQLIAKEGIAAEDLHDFHALGWLGKECGADFAIAGTVEDTGESLVLMVELIRTNHPGRVQQRRGALERTPEMVALLSQPFHFEAAPPLAYGIPEAGKQGVGEPSCRICPTPSFTDALNEAMQDKPFVLTFRILVDQNGDVADIAVVKGAPYGVTDQAIETLRKWKLEPAKDADGRPVKVWTLVEVTFRHL